MILNKVVSRMIFKRIVYVLILLVLTLIIYISLAKSSIEKQYKLDLEYLQEVNDNYGSTIIKNDISTLPEPIIAFYEMSGIGHKAKSSNVRFTFKDADFDYVLFSILQ